MNPCQIAAKNAYGDGDFAYVTSTAEASELEDTLFEFILRELTDVGDDAIEAVRRLDRAKSDLDDVIAAIQARGR
jgi:hypothetical protein